MHGGQMSISTEWFNRDTRTVSELYGDTVVSRQLSITVIDTRLRPQATDHYVARDTQPFIRGTEDTDRRTQCRSEIGTCDINVIPKIIVGVM
jgi:hypothetical protein